jgi:hypothetical protein
MMTALGRIERRVVIALDAVALGAVTHATAKRSQANVSTTKPPRSHGHEHRDGNDDSDDENQDLNGRHV